MLKKAVTLGLMLAFTQRAFAQDYIMDTSSIGKDRGGVIRSEQLLELGIPNANALRLEGENSLRLGHIDRAIMVLQRSVEMAPMDMDGRILYAQALEQKMFRQKERDPGLFNFICKQWMFVWKRAEFADQSLQARAHLANLTGINPGRFEKAEKYLSRVMLPEDGSEKVTIGKRRSTDKERTAASGSEDLR